MELKKRGIIFTLISLLLSGMFIILYTTDVRTPLDTKVDLYTMKATGIRVYTDSLETYLDYALEIGGQDAMQAVLDYERQRNEPLETVDGLRCAFADALIDGIISTRNATDLAQYGPPPPYYPFLTLFRDTEGQEFLASNVRSVEGLPIGSSQANMTQGIVMRFTANHTGKIDTVQLGVQNSDDRSGNLSVEIYSSSCNSTVFLLDRANAIIPAGGEAQIANFQFPYHAVLRKNTDYLLLISADKPMNLTLGNPLEGSIPYVQKPLNMTVWRNFSDGNLTGKSSIMAYLEKVYNVSRTRMGINANHTIIDMSIQHESAWEIRVDADVLFQVNDNFSTYDRLFHTTSYFTIDGMPEPLLLLGRNLSRQIVRAPFGVDYGFNISIITNFTRNNYSWERAVEGPSFLYRMINWSNSSGNFGIETILPNLYVGNRSNVSYVDWHFLNSTEYECTDIMYINATMMKENGLSENDYMFWYSNNGTSIDIESLVRYNVSNMFWNLTCTLP